MRPSEKTAIDRATVVISYCRKCTSNDVNTKGNRLRIFVIASIFENLLRFTIAEIFFKLAIFN